MLKVPRLLAFFAALAVAFLGFAASAEAKEAGEEVDNVFQAELELFKNACENDLFVPWAGDKPDEWKIVDLTQFLKANKFASPTERYQQVTLKSDQLADVIVEISDGVPYFGLPGDRIRTCSVIFKAGSMNELQAVFERSVSVGVKTERTREKAETALYKTDEKHPLATGKSYHIHWRTDTGWAKVSTTLECSDQPRPSAFKNQPGGLKCPKSWYE